MQTALSWPEQVEMATIGIRGLVQWERGKGGVGAPGNYGKQEVVSMLDHQGSPSDGVSVLRFPCLAGQTIEYACNAML